MIQIKFSPVRGQYHGFLQWSAGQNLFNLSSSAGALFLYAPERCRGDEVECFGR